MCGGEGGGGEFKKMTTKSNGSYERIKKSGGRQFKIAKEEGIMSKGNFEQMRSGWNQEENKACCFERGSTDRFKASLPIWIAKKKKMECCPASSRYRNDLGKGRWKGKKGKTKSANFFLVWKWKKKKLMKNTK